MPALKKVDMRNVLRDEGIMENNSINNQKEIAIATDVNIKSGSNKKIICGVVAIIFIGILLFLLFKNNESEVVESNFDMVIKRFYNTIQAESFSYSQSLNDDARIDGEYDFLTVDGKKVYGFKGGERSGYIEQREDRYENGGFNVSRDSQNTYIEYTELNTQVSYEVYGILPFLVLSDLDFVLWNCRQLNEYISYRYALTGLQKGVNDYLLNQGEESFVMTYKYTEDSLFLKVDLYDFLYWCNDRDDMSYVMPDEASELIGNESSVIFEFEFDEEYVTSFQWAYEDLLMGELMGTYNFDNIGEDMDDLMLLSDIGMVEYWSIIHGELKK